MRQNRLVGAAAATLLALSLASCASGSTGPTPPESPHTPAKSAAAADTASAAAGGYTGGAALGVPCGTVAQATYQHVIWIWMENRSYESVLGADNAAPELRSYADACGLATDYHGITHPSLPNYLAATGGSTGGVTNDCGPLDCPQDRGSIFGQATKHGLQWRGYAEAMDRRCDRASHGTYAARHNPAVYFTPITAQCRKKDVLMGGASGNFAQALAAPNLPAFAFVTPDLCHDGHDCATGVADAWLGKWLDRITASAAYAAGDTLVVVTWDEGVGGNHIATVMIGPSVPAGTKVGDRFNHYSLLRTTEEILGLPLLRRAKLASSMRAAFHL